MRRSFLATGGERNISLEHGHGLCVLGLVITNIHKHIVKVLNHRPALLLPPPTVIDIIISACGQNAIGLEGIEHVEVLLSVVVDGDLGRGLALQLLLVTDEKLLVRVVRVSLHILVQIVYIIRQ